MTKVGCPTAVLRSWYRRALELEGGGGTVADEDEMTEVIRVRVRAGFSERLKGQAQRESRDSAVKITVSDVIRKAVEAYLKRHGG